MVTAEVNIGEGVPRGVDHLFITLADAVLSLERASGKPSQLVARVGDMVVLVGDLRKRAGQYGLQMKAEYRRDPYDRDAPLVPNACAHLAGTYDSFDAIERAVEAESEVVSTDFSRRRNHDPKPHLIGHPQTGSYSIGFRVGGEAEGYVSVGSITPPRLQDHESISIDLLVK